MVSEAHWNEIAHWIDVKWFGTSGNNLWRGGEKGQIDVHCFEFSFRIKFLPQFVSLVKIVARSKRGIKTNRIAGRTVWSNIDNDFERYMPFLVLKIEIWRL